MRKLLFIVLALSILGLAAHAGDEPQKDPDAEKAQKEAEAKKKKEEALARQAKAAIAIFRKQVKHKKKTMRMKAILELGMLKHDLVIDELGKKVMVHKDTDARDLAAQMLGEMKQNPKRAGEYLKKHLMKNEKFPGVQISIIRSIGKLGYMDALEELKDACKHLNETKYEWVTVEVVRTFGVLKDNRTLPFLLWLSEYGGKWLRWATGEVTVDTGTAGDADQRAAEAEWRKRYGHIGPSGPQAPVIRRYMEELANTVEKLTGQRFKNATKFRAWLVAHAKEYGLDPKKLSKNAK
ncbi:MAG: HEAT repeat domain-containing protein [Planctomycetota bacterium]|jgi:hypothetical protein